MHALLRRGPRSLRGAVVRFVRLLLMEQPQCATCVVSHQLLPVREAPCSLVRVRVSQPSP